MDLTHVSGRGRRWGLSPAGNAAGRTAAGGGGGFRERLEAGKPCLYISGSRAWLLYTGRIGEVARLGRSRQPRRRRCARRATGGIISRQWQQGSCFIFLRRGRKFDAVLGTSARDDHRWLPEMTIPSRAFTSLNGEKTLLVAGHGFGVDSSRGGQDHTGSV